MLVDIKENKYEYQHIYPDGLLQNIHWYKTILSPKPYYINDNKALHKSQSIIDWKKIENNVENRVLNHLQ